MLEIISANPKAGERAMEPVYEKLTGECWHEASGMIWICGKCKTDVGWNGSMRDSVAVETLNPPLLTSLDAWRPLWEIIKQWPHEKVQLWLDSLEIAVLGHTIDIATEGDVLQVVLAKPHHHLEAALRTLEGEYPECGRRYGFSPRGDLLSLSKTCPTCYAGLESPIPQTAPEAYYLQEMKKMAQLAKECETSYMHKDDIAEGWVHYICDFPDDLLIIGENCAMESYKEKGHHKFSKWRWCDCKFNKCKYLKERPATIQEVLDGKATRA